MRAAKKSTELYKVLGVDPSASQEVIRKQYYKLALLHHPDRATGEQNDNKVFQSIGQAYEILNDTNKRKLYDETGVIDGLDQQQGEWTEYFCELFKKVSFDDIDAFKAVYVGSLEEYEDILAAYVKNRGDMEAISDSVFFGDVQSEDRYLKVIKRAFERGIVPQFKAIEKIMTDDSAYRAQQRKRKRHADIEAKQAAELAKELGLVNGNSTSLVSAIQNRQQGRYDTLIANLEAKYSPKSKSKKANTK